MPRLAILEDAKRRSARLTRGQREAVARLVAEVLGRRPEVVLGILFGGVLVEGKPVRDIDVAVYTGHRVAPEEWPVYVDELRVELERALRARLGLVKAVDVVVLEYVPPRLRAEVLRRGRVVVDRSPGLRGVLLLRALDEARGLERTRASAGGRVG